MKSETKSRLWGWLMCSLMVTSLMSMALLFLDALYRDKYGIGLIYEIVRGW